MPNKALELTGRRLAGTHGFALGIRSSGALGTVERLARESKKSCRRLCGDAVTK